MKPIRLAVVHWFPIEYYPPVTNLMNLFGRNTHFAISCYTSHNAKNRSAFTNEACRIHRYKFPQPGQSLPIRLFSYLAFPLAVLVRLLWLRPAVILYVEPQSVMPVFLYTLLARRCRILIHNHEYHDQHQFLRPGMRLVRLYHWLEKKFIFRRAEWISQTNADRIRLFLEDFPDINPEKLHDLPNLPPKEWTATKNRAWEQNDDQLRLVYVGSLSCQDTFVREIVEWVETDADQHCQLDIYSYNHTADVKQLFDDCKSDRVNFFHDGIPYEQLPDVLTNYHVGLILYKATTTNYVFNASNKLFEYLALGLDVWYPAQMLGVKPYAREDKAPRVIELNFEQLESFDVASMQERPQLESPEATESCENALRSLAIQILEERIE